MAYALTPFTFTLYKMKKTIKIKYKYTKTYKQCINK